MTGVLVLASLVVLTPKSICSTWWRSFFTYVHGATTTIAGLILPTLAQLKSYFPDTPGPRFTAFVFTDTLTFIALLVFLGASWLGDASVMTLTIIGTLRTLVHGLWDLALGIALSRAPSPKGRPHLLVVGDGRGGGEGGGGRRPR